MGVAEEDLRVVVGVGLGECGLGGRVYERESEGGERGQKHKEGRVVNVFILVIEFRIVEGVCVRQVNR